MGEQVCRIPAEQMLREQARVEIGRGGDAGAAQPIARGCDELANCLQETAVASFSFSDW
jgi:virulence-associated protein VagC